MTRTFAAIQIIAAFLIVLVIGFLGVVGLFAMVEGLL